MCQFFDRRVVYYSLACGHYRVYAGDTEPCPEAESKTKLVSEGYARTERQICDAIINEIERQRPSRSWSFHFCIDGKKIEILVDSSGHCEVWKGQGYKKPTYQQFPKTSGTESLSTSRSSETVNSVTASTPLSSKSNPKVRLSARLQNRIAKEWNGLFLLKKSFPQQASGLYPEHQSMTEHGRAASGRSHFPQLKLISS